MEFKGAWIGLGIGLAATIGWEIGKGSEFSTDSFRVSILVIVAFAVIGHFLDPNRKKS
jgi:hypothetical protein